MKNVSPAKRTGGAPPVFVIAQVLKLRRLLHQIADAIVPPAAPLIDRFMGAATTSLLATAARLRIADHLEDGGPMTAEQLAERTGVRADLLERSLKALVASGVFRRDGDGRFANNGVSRGLRTGAPGNMRGFAEFFGNHDLVRTWLAHEQILKDGGSAFERVHGRSFWEWMGANEDVRSAFVEGMSSTTEELAPAIASLCPFDQVERLCDVGGGVGIVLGAALARHDHLSGMLFDDQAMLADAPQYLKGWGVDGRVDLVHGDFMQEVPRGADAYMLKMVLHNWEDERASLILRNCRAAMERGHLLLVVDFVDAPDTLTSLVPYMDMVGMMMCGGGMERSEEAMERLFTQAGFAYRRLIPLPASQGIFVGVAS